MEERITLFSVFKEYMFDNIIIGILSSFVWFLLGTIFLYLSKLIVVVRPTKRLWNIKSPKNLIICAATSTKTDTGEYQRPATGIGQLRALAYCVESLSKVYDLKIQNILLSIDQIQKQIENDIILLGGPKNNEITKLFLNKIAPMKLVDQKGVVIRWMVGNNQFEYQGQTSNSEVIKDFGLIVRMKNPFDTQRKSTICLFSGSHTYGTIAAAKYFSYHYIKKMKFYHRKYENIVIVVECDVINGYPVDIKLMNKYEF